MTQYEDALANQGFLLNPIISVVPGSPPVQEILDGSGFPIATLLLSNPPTLIGLFPPDALKSLLHAGFVVESPLT